jgi:hypothetical protein
LGVAADSIGGRLNYPEDSLAGNDGVKGVSSRK